MTKKIFMFKKLEPANVALITHKGIKSPSKKITYVSSNQTIISVMDTMLKIHL